MRAHRYTLPDRYYAMTIADDGGLLPGNATHEPLPPAPWTGLWPRWTGDSWELVEDHRERTAAQFDTAQAPEQPATDYWLPGDTWETPARHMKKPGPLPEGALLTRPEKPADVVEAERWEALRSMRDVKLQETDYLLMPDYPIPSTALENVKVYRQQLRDLPAQPGAPWDGGGERTPWPEKPEPAEATPCA